MNVAQDTEGLFRINFINGAVVGIQYYFDSYSFKAMADALAEKYGPSRDEVATYENDFERPSRESFIRGPTPPQE
jgi:hypothetical protein